MSLLNKAQARKYMLSYAKRTRPRFTRVSADVYDTLESNVRKTIRKMVDSHPSMGKTIKP